jgi:hypothetical protein
MIAHKQAAVQGNSPSLAVANNLSRQKGGKRQTAGLGMTTLEDDVIQTKIKVNNDEDYKEHYPTSTPMIKKLPVESLDTVWNIFQTVNHLFSFQNEQKFQEAGTAFIEKEIEVVEDIMLSKWEPVDKEIFKMADWTDFTEANVEKVGENDTFKAMYNVFLVMHAIQHKDKPSIGNPPKLILEFMNKKFVLSPSLKQEGDVSWGVTFDKEFGEKKGDEKVGTALSKIKEILPTKYKVDGCEPRAHFASWYLNQLGYESGIIRVWSKTGGDETPKEPFDYKGKWKMHTAAYVVFDSGTFILDPQLDNPIKESTWTGAFPSNWETSKDIKWSERHSGGGEKGFREMISTLRRYYLAELNNEKSERTDVEKYLPLRDVAIKVPEKKPPVVRIKFHGKVSTSYIYKVEEGDETDYMYKYNETALYFVSDEELENFKVHIDGKKLSDPQIGRIWKIK